MVMTALRPSRSRLATSLIFLANGIGIGAWAASIPGIKARLDLSGTALGFGLLMLAAGAMAAMPLAGWLGAKRGGLIAGSGGLFAASLLLPAVAPGYLALLPALFVLGAANGALDVLMNAGAARVEAAWGGAIMSSFHACWSLGGLLGAGGAAVAVHFGAGVLPFAAAAVAALVGGGGRVGGWGRACRTVQGRMPAALPGPAGPPRGSARCASWPS
jgi:MFS family permease